MTKQQALDQLRVMQAWHEDNGNGPNADYDAICYAINIIEAQPEKFTDIEQRIFLAAMSKEEKVCREVDKEPSDADCINLMRVCKSIERKVKGALWT